MEIELNKLQLELGSVAMGSFYGFQEMRIKSYNRIRNIVFRKVKGFDLREVQDKKKEKEYLKEFEDKELYKWIAKLKHTKKIDAKEETYLEKIFELLRDSEAKEKQYLALVQSHVNDEVVWNDYLKYVRGIGPLMTSALLYYFGYCEKAKYPSSLRSFAGLTPDSKYVKGESSKFNPKCRMFVVGRLGTSLIRAKNVRYSPIYKNEKERQESLRKNKAENASKSLLHSHRRAVRKMVSVFLLDYWRMCIILRTGKKPIYSSYVIDKMGHKPTREEIEVYVAKERKKAEKKELGM